MLPPPSEPNDRRGKLRVGFETQVIVRVDESEYKAAGNSRDLSLNGVFVRLTDEIPVGTKCAVKVVLTGNILLEMTGAVARREKDGIGIAFQSMDLDSYTHLKNIVRYNSANPDEVY